MTSTWFARRRTTLPLAALIAVGAATLAVAVSGARDSEAESGHGTATASARITHKWRTR